MTTTSSRSLLTLAVLAGTLALIPPGAEARRSGGGHGSGTNHSTHHDAPPTAQHSVPPAASTHHVENYGADTARAVSRAEALDAPRRSRIPARYYRERSASAAGAASAVAAGADSDDALRVIEASRRNARQPDGGAPSRIADPRFARITDNATPGPACEFKPVMADADYIACGANPPTLPAGN